VNIYVNNRLDPHKFKEKNNFPVLNKVSRHKAIMANDCTVPRILGTKVRQRLPSRQAALLLVKDLH